MGKEIEIKAKIDNIDKVLSWLADNALSGKVIFQKDILYDFIPRTFILNQTDLKADEFLRIRYTNQGDILTHKIIHRDSVGNFLYCEENESIINSLNYKNINKILLPFEICNLTDKDCSDGTVLEAWLEKNHFRELIRISKKRTEYYWQRFNIAVDEVLHLGYFIEIESLQNSDDENLIKTIKDNELQLLNKMQIPTTNIVNKGYFDLIIELHHSSNIE